MGQSTVPGVLQRSAETCIVGGSELGVRGWHGRMRVERLRRFRPKRRSTVHGTDVVLTFGSKAAGCATNFTWEIRRNPTCVWDEALRQDGMGSSLSVAG